MDFGPSGTCQRPLPRSRPWPTVARHGGVLVTPIVADRALPDILVDVERGSGDSEPTGRKNTKTRPEVGTEAEGPEEAKVGRHTPSGADAGGQSRQEILHEALEAARAEHQTQAQRLEAARTQLQSIVEWIETGRPQREVLRESAFARMHARLDSLPVIEQAKGILMAQQRCGPEEAFELLRRASQRANVKVNVLADQIVEQVASPKAETSAQSPPRAANRRR